MGEWRQAFLRERQKREAAEARIADLEAKVKDLEELTRFERVLELEAEVEKTKEYAEEGWAWLDEALAALGAKTVFDIAPRKVEVERLTVINVERIDTHNRNLARAQTAEVKVERLWEALEHVRDKSATLGDASHRARAALASLEGEGR